MIYAKIYLDKNEKGEEMIVFDATSERNIHCQPAGSYVNARGHKIFNERTSITPTTSILASQEALDAFKNKISYGNDKFRLRKYEGDFKLYRTSAGFGSENSSVFEFAPDKLNSIKKTLRLDDELTICAEDGYDTSVLNQISIAENEFVRNLDITKPVPEPEQAQQQKSN